jgi:hypothetical protein
VPALLLRYLPHIAAVAALIGALWWYGHRCDQTGYERAQAEMAEAVRKAEEATRAAEARAQQITEAKDREWQTERNTLEGRITDLLARPAAPIRLCKSAGRGQVPGVPGPAREPDGAAAEPGSAMQAGPDLRGPLVLYGGDCERTRAQLSAIQAWIREQANR